MNGPSHQVVIVGGGFAGLAAARGLRRAPVQVTLIDRRNFHLFQPLLYQVATGALSPANIAAPLRAILSRQGNVRVIHGEATGIDVGLRHVLLGSQPVRYDTLIVATGVTHDYFGHDDWSDVAPGLKTIEDATTIRARVLSAFERAELLAAVRGAGRPVEPPLTFAVVGGGPTGVEMAGAIAEIARHTLRHEFRAIDPSRARILLLEGGPRILAAYSPRLAERAVAALERLGVTVVTQAVVTAVDEGGVTCRRPDGRSERFEAGTVIWAAGVRASPLGVRLAEACGAELDRAGRVKVAPDLTLPAHPDVLVLGDLAHVATPAGLLPGVAPVAMQQGRYAARVIASRLSGRAAPPPFRYRDFGMMATIGRAAAVARIGGFEFSGYVAWLLWLFVHLMYLVEFQNRVLVLLQWAWNYFTRNRAARLITREEAGHDVVE